jgi:sugar lactone lactonase YvrE
MMGTRRWAPLVVVAAVLAWLMPQAVGQAAPRQDGGTPELLASGLQGGSGSTVGPDGALYLTEGVAGRLTRVDPRTGTATTVATCLPRRIAPIGGAMDVAFLGRTPYVLVTLVGADVGGTDAVGIYRVDGPDDCAVVADIGAFSIAHPPRTDFFVPTGVQYAMQTYRGGFLVTDGHHNRVLRVTPDGRVGELIAFPDIVPTGLERKGGTVYMAEAGPVPHLPRDGKIVSFRAAADPPVVRDVASGGRLLVDVEFGPRGDLYALAQGVFPADGEPGAPALPDTGSLLRAEPDGTFDVVASGLDRPTSLEFIGDTAYVVTLTGEIWAVDDVSASGRDAS